jgi:hypothetical protein
MILPTVLHVCEAWSFTLRKEQRFRVFGNWVHKEKFHNLYASPNVIRVTKRGGMRWAGHVGRMGELGHAYDILVQKPEGKKQLARPSHRREENI